MKNIIVKGVVAAAVLGSLLAGAYLASAQTVIMPTCTLSVVGPTALASGESATLSWTSTNARSMLINQGVGSENSVVSGSVSVTPSSLPITYTGTWTGVNGSVSCSTTLEPVSSTTTVTTAVAPAVTPVTVTSTGSPLQPSSILTEMEVRLSPASWPPYHQTTRWPSIAGEDYGRWRQYRASQPRRAAYGLAISSQ